jgi:4-oxalocrotonate tautomerase
MGSAPEHEQRKDGVMPLVDIHLIEGVFDKNQKQEMINKVTNAMVEIEGEAMRGVTWVRVYEVASGEWAIGGKALSAADVKAMQAVPSSNAK